MKAWGVARQEALVALGRVRNNVPVAEALTASHQTTSMSANDRALLTQLVYGVLRHRRYLDAVIEPFVRQELEPDIRDILRMGFFQLKFLNRIPPYAVVNAAVEQTKAIQPKASRLVNAVLRRGQQYEPTNLNLAVQYSHPDWLVARWATRFGNRLPEILAENNKIPPLTLRVNSTKASRDDVLRELKRLNIEAEPSRFVPEAIRVTGSLWLEHLPWFQNGWVSVQDESGMLVSHVLDPQPGDHILDLTAGVGGKTGHLAEMTRGQAKIVAIDASAHRLMLLQQNLERLGVAGGVTTQTGDAQSILASMGRSQAFDKVLVDAPCSNLGVLRRRVDARWRKQEQNLVEHQALQRQLLASAIEVTKPGGVLVYSTCSIEPEETTEVIAAMLTQFADVHKDSVMPYLPTPLPNAATADGMLTIVPGDYGMDGFFIARLVKDAGGE
ncbi:MAG: 16S rRNA (cytosine(967)-C(5))-methyltransferase RsmB [Sulfobacillus benefaciens]|uniref:16S rRNA (cytosine(967)-C(5))-methyltransferase n=1 Tax=Sulfobacillus benefaciens TaxID=453960 RepID=A0A2T2XJN1_9FIRM|nr:MAG: 16S rRNA (cytosine(967)-C(5))-methyltransferase RsmB [Sulfobacillus benefaciens]